MEDQKEKQYKRFKKIDEEWRNDMLGRSEDDVRKVITETTINWLNLKFAKQFDEDLARLAEEKAAAEEVYKTGEKENILKLEFLIETLRSRGADVGEVTDYVKGGKSTKAVAKTIVKDALQKMKDSAPGTGISISVGGKTTVIQKPSS